MRGKVSKRSIDALGPGTRDAFLWDTDIKGFGLKVTPEGRKVYILQYRFNGRLRRFTIGRHGSPWTPEKARKEAGRLLGLVADNTDPAEIKIAARQDLTMSELCDLYIKTGCSTKKASTVAMDESRIERHVKPLLGHLKVKSMTKADIDRFMQDVAAGKTALDKKTGSRGRSIVRGGKGVASRAVGMLGSIFTFAIDQGFRTDNPVRGVKRYADGKNERFLSEVEWARLGETLSITEQEGENQTAIAAILLLALTGCRKAEILSLRWEHVDLNHRCLRLADSKTGAKVVPLNTPALRLLASLPRIEDNPHVLPSHTTDGHFIGLQRVWERIRSRAKLPGLRLHDLRHSFAAMGATGGDSLIVIGALLGHQTSSATSRYAHLSASPVQAATERISGKIADALLGKALKGGQVTKLIGDESGS